MPKLDEYLSAGKLSSQADVYGINAAGKEREREARTDLFTVEKAKRDSVFSAVGGASALGGTLYENYTRAIEKIDKAKEASKSLGMMADEYNEKGQATGFWEDLWDRAGLAFGKEPTLNFWAVENEGSGLERVSFKADDIINASEVIDKKDVLDFWKRKPSKSIYDYLIGDTTESAVRYTKSAYDLEDQR